MQNSDSSITDIKIGDKIVLNEEGISYHKRRYKSSMNDVVYAIVIQVDNSVAMVCTKWINYKGIVVMPWWYFHLKHIKLYEKKD